MTRRLVAVGAALAVSLAACGGSGGGKGSSSSNGSDTAKSGNSNSASDAFGKLVSATGSVNSYRMKMTQRFTQGGQVITMNGSGAGQKQPPLAEVKQTQSIAGTSRETDSVISGDTWYMKMTGPGQPPTGQPWIKMSISQLKSGMDQLGKKYGVQNSGGNQDSGPDSFSKMLAASKDAHKVGSESIGGVQTTHYQGTLTKADIQAALPDQSQQEQYLHPGVALINFDVWIDDQGLPHKVILKSDGTQGSFDQTSEFYDFNKPVSVKIPPASEVRSG